MIEAKIVRLYEKCFALAKMLVTLGDSEVKWKRSEVEFCECVFELRKLIKKWCANSLMSAHHFSDIRIH